MPIGTQIAALWPGTGLLADWPVPAAFAVLLVARSLAAYWLHRCFHTVPWCWSFHRVHHADTAVDCTTGLRNHPLEGIIAAALAAFVVLALGVRPGTVATVNGVLLVASFWHHAAIRLPDGVSRSLEWLMVTPRLHFVHHAPARADHDQNFGDILIVWDRLFGTYAKPAARIAAVGLGDDARAAQSLVHQLAAPFKP